MSHPEQLAFLARVAALNPSAFAHGRVLEIGSYDVNGTVRGLFADCDEYVGVDVVPGPGVDHVGKGHLVPFEDASFDVAISAECFEHDPHWRETLATMVRATRSAGLVCFTCAGRGRPEHGTSRTTVRDSPGSRDVLGDYYLNLTERDVRALPLDQWFSDYRFYRCRSNSDLYFVAQRRGTRPAARVSFPEKGDIRSIEQLMPLPRRVVRWPARLLATAPISEKTFQDLVVPWWAALQRRWGDAAPR